MIVDFAVNETLGVKPVAGSFRDRSNRVYMGKQEVLRGIDQRALENWRALQQQDFYRNLISRRSVIPTELVSEPVDLGEDWAGVLSHERVEFISYPYEWSFGMLKDAALLHLEMIEQAIPNGWVLKDSSAYNIQWADGRPVFIDIPSFEPYEAGTPWVGYRQFCMMFLFPLMLRAYKGIDFAPFMRSNLEGIDPDLANRLLTGFDRFRSGVLGNVYLHAKMQERAKYQDLDEAKELTETAGGAVKASRQFRHTEAMVLGTIQGLSRLVKKLEPKRHRSTWGNYAKTHSYSDASFDRKAEFVERHASKTRRKVVWDVGCNTGTFSRIAAKHADLVISIDGDAAAIEDLYQTVKADGPKNIMPIITDLGNPSPNQGWRGAERTSLEMRGKPDLVICLAVVHHMVISANIPLREVVRWLRSLDAEVIFEFVSLQDQMSQMLLRNRVNQYQDLTEANFEEEVRPLFEVVESIPLKEGNRRLYCLRPL